MISHGDLEDLAGGVVDEHEHVERLEGDGLDGEVVTRHDRRGLGAKELRLSRTVRARCRGDVVAAEDLPHGGRGDGHVAADQLAMDAPIAP